MNIYSIQNSLIFIEARKFNDMDYVKIAILFVALILVSLPGNAQNNQYKIDDSCYPLYRQADSLIATETVDSLIDLLYVQAQKVHDEKSLTLVNVLKLRRSIRRQNEARIINDYNALKDVSLKTGYLQYYFYSYHLISVYYFNAGQKIKGLDYAVKMHEDAVRLNNDYGKWYSSKYLGELYLADFKRNNATRYFEESVETYNKTDDPMIKAQSMTKPYALLAMLNGVSSSGYQDFYDKALETSKIGIDTITVDYLHACHAAAMGDYRTYNTYKNVCLSNRLFIRAKKSGSKVFDIIDSAIAGNWKAVSEQMGGISRLEDMMVLSDVAIVFNNLDFLRLCYEQIANQIVITYEDQLNQALYETELMMENETLSQSVIEQKTRANAIMIVLVIVIALAVILSGIMTYIYVKKLKQAMYAADAANRMKTYFVQNMSHEIRTPLNAVVGYSQLLALSDGLIGKEEKDEYITYINNNASMLMMLIDDILDLSDIDSGNYRLNLGDCHCNEICRMALNTVQCRILPGVKSSFSTDVPDDLVIESDERRLQQILINFLTNSSKFTTEGEIRLVCSMKEKPGYISFAVEDTGAGIPPEKADFIFQRFSKLDSFKQGSGLGLNICMVLSDKLGGIVELDKNYGRVSGKSDSGSRFLLHIPLVTP